MVTIIKINTTKDDAASVWLQWKTDNLILYNKKRRKC